MSRITNCRYLYQSHLKYVKYKRAVWNIVFESSLIHVVYVGRVETLLGNAHPAARHRTKHIYVEKCSYSLYFSDPESGGDEVRGISNPLITAVNWDWRATSREIPRQKWDLGCDTEEETRRLVLKPSGSAGRRGRMRPTRTCHRAEMGSEGLFLVRGPARNWDPHWWFQ